MEKSNQKQQQNKYPFNPWLDSFINDRIDPYIRLTPVLKEAVKKTYNNWFRDQPINKKEKK